VTSQSRGPGIQEPKYSSSFTRAASNTGGRINRQLLSVNDRRSRRDITALPERGIAMIERNTQLHFEAPGPGPWEQDPVHLPRPMTRYFQETQPAAIYQGSNNFARFYGLLIDGLNYRYVNGFGYMQVIPAPEQEIPGRFARAGQVVEQKLWRQQLRDWDEVRKPTSIAAHRELQSVNSDLLSDTELVAYLTRCRDHHAAMTAQHMSFTAGAVIPVGDFLAHVGDWTGLPHSELLGLMRG
jgi:pyruvate,water dikinase